MTATAGGSQPRCTRRGRWAATDGCPRRCADRVGLPWPRRPVGGDRGGVGHRRVEAVRRALAPARRWHEGGRAAEAEVGGHVHVDRLVPIENVGLMEDADVAVVPDPPVELPPGGEVCVVAGAGVVVEVLGAAPVLHGEDRAPADVRPVGEQTELGVLAQLPEHLGHRRDDRQPLPHLPRPVDPHADEECHRPGRGVGGHPTGERCPAHGFLLRGAEPGARELMWTLTTWTVQHLRWTLSTWRSRRLGAGTTTTATSAPRSSTPRSSRPAAAVRTPSCCVTPPAAPGCRTTPPTVTSPTATTCSPRSPSAAWPTSSGGCARGWPPCPTATAPTWRPRGCARWAASTCTSPSPNPACSPPPSPAAARRRVRPRLTDPTACSAPRSTTWSRRACCPPSAVPAPTSPAGRRCTGSRCSACRGRCGSSRTPSARRSWTACSTGWRGDCSRRGGGRRRGGG